MNTATLTTYEDRLNAAVDWALREGSMHFEEKSAVHLALRKIAARLEQLKVPYAVAGGMAMFLHGYRRFTEDVDILVSTEGLATLHGALAGRGYLPPFEGSKNLRDTEHGVRIEFLVAGQFPGDGKPKPVAFPDPASTRMERDGIQILPLKDLVELKLASGMTDAGRLKDLADVQEMIRVLGLPEEFEVNDFVRERYRELWRGVHP